MKKENPKLLAAQAFVNVEDISDGILYARDGLLFGYLKIRAGDNRLMNENERIAAAENLATGLSGEREPWQLLSIPRTVDTLGMLEYLTGLRRQTKEDARLRLISGEIAALQALAREGTKEPFLALKCWVKAARGADAVLKKRLRDLRSRLTENRVSAEIMSDTEIVYLCKLFADLSSHQSEEGVRPEEIPLLEGHRRTLRRAATPDNADLLNLITPVGGIFFGLSSVVAGTVRGRIYGAMRYPAELDYGWCTELMNASDCVSCITFHPGSNSELGDALSRSIHRSSVEAASENDVRRRKRFERQARDADRLIEEMDYKNAPIGHMSLLVMPFTGGDEEALEEVCRYAAGRFGRKRIKLKPLGGLQKQAYRQLSPYHPNQPEIDNIVRCIMPLETLAGGAPMTVNIYRDDKGFYFGRTMDGGVISLDLLYRGRDRTNGNIVATGKAGTGKSTALKHLIQSLYMSGVKVIVIDPEREFRDLCRNLGGTWLDAGGGEAKINPLQIRPVPEDEEEPEGGRLYRATENAMALHIHTLEVLFQLYLPGLTDIQRALLKKSLVELYAAFGITWESDVRAIAPEAFPVVADLYRLLLQQTGEDPRYGDLALLFYDMAEGADSFLWNGHTNVSMSSPMVVLDTNRLIAGSDEIKRAQYFNILTLCWEVMSADRGEPVFLLCDEAHILLDPNIPQTCMYLRNMAKRARKYESMLGVVLQSVVDVVHEEIRLYGQAILDNAAYKLFFGTDGKNLQETAELFQLTEAEQNILLSGERGKALCFLGSQHVHVDFDIPQYKLDLMGTGGGR